VNTGGLRVVFESRNSPKKAPEIIIIAICAANEEYLT